MAIKKLSEVDKILSQAKASEIVAAMALMMVYFVTLMIVPIWIFGSLLQAWSISPLSNMGLLYTALASSFYILLELFILYNGRPAPMLVITMSVILSPWLAVKGINVLSNEYDRIRQVLALV